MACENNVCGTGGWAGPLPGDPDNNLVLSATPAFGGIDIAWSYPASNPAAVAHTILYRGTTNHFEWAIQYRICAGDNFYDAIPKSLIREYFYWIQVVSVNGTVGDPIGPAVCIPKGTIEEIMQDLSGLIDDTLLSESLRGKLDMIALLQGDLANESVARFAANTALSDAIAAVQSETGQALVFIQDEITTRTTANEAMLDSVNALAVGLGDASAALAEETLLRVTAESAIAARITAVETNVGDNVAAALVSIGTRISEVEGQATQLEALYTAKLDVNGLIGGFGISNNGHTVDAGFDVDRFWIGRATDKVKPFIIDNGVVYIANAAIQDGAITNAKIGNTIQSIDFSEGMAGWRIDKTGQMEMNDAIFRGTLDIKSATSGARIEQTNNFIKVFGDAGNLLIHLGDLTA